MSLRPLGPPEFLAADPGPWSVVSSIFARTGRPGRRRPEPPAGLMLAPPPETRLPLAGLDPEAAIAGAGPLRIVGAAREPAFRLAFDPAGDVLRGISPFVARAWSVPDLVAQPERRPGEDPAAGLPDPLPLDALADGLPDDAARSPGGELVAVSALEGRARALAVIRVGDGALVRFVRGARAGAWSPDGRLFAVGGEWGVLLGRPLASADAGGEEGADGA